MLKYSLYIFMTLLMMACSGPLEGLWVDVDESAILKFEGSSLINNSLRGYWRSDNLQFDMDQDSITWIGLNPEMNDGKTTRSFKYRLDGDSLGMWFRPDYETVFVKSGSNNYLEHFLARGKVSIDLPTAESAKERCYHCEYLNIRIGFRGQKTVIFVDEVETPLELIDSEIKKFKAGVSEWMLDAIVCRLFIDNRITCDYMNWLYPCLRSNDIRVVTFATLAKGYDVYTSDFWGIKTVLPLTPINYVEEE
jgi:hypothetical protein